LKLKKGDTLQAKVDDYNVLEQDIALDTEITVTFSEKIDKNSIDTGSLTLFNLDGVGDSNNQDVSICSKSATFTLQNQLLPGTHYETTISSNVQEQTANFLDCSGSSGVDSLCQWQFTTGS
jgi:hypothetical protein